METTRRVHRKACDLDNQVHCRRNLLPHARSDSLIPVIWIIVSVGTCISCRIRVDGGLKIHHDQCSLPEDVNGFTTSDLADHNTVGSYRRAFLTSHAG